MLSLRGKIFILILGLLLVNFGGALMTLVYVHSVHGYVAKMKDSIKALLTFVELENSILKQKESTTYYLLSQDERLLSEISGLESAFRKQLLEARSFFSDSYSLNLIDTIETSYKKLTSDMEKLTSLELKNSGSSKEYYWNFRDKLGDLYILLQNHRRFYEKRIAEAEEASAKRARYITIFSIVAIPLSCVVAFFLGWILFKQILDPLRLLAQTISHTGNGRIDNEISELKLKIEKLKETVDTTQSALEESREHLIQAEKMALVGKLAAGVAHSVLNPLTSVKMRLFSLERSLNLDPGQREDFEVISEEIKHIDTILRNFLEFSRPPKPKIQSVSLSDVVDTTLQLLKHRIESYNVSVEIYRDRRLPPVDIDPDQFKEALINIILNACEAMGDGGRIIIEEKEGYISPTGRVVTLTIKDTGPGIPESIIDKIFEPFFSTKEDGSGLGLSIAKRIIEEHKGWINCKSQKGMGATFTIVLPCKKSDKWLRS